MPTFETPEPILATIEVVVGDLRIMARDRTDTIVEVRPSDPSHEPDVRAAEQTRVEMTSDGLLVKGPKQRGLPLFGKPGSVDVTIDLPTGSRLRADTGVAALRCTGRAGRVPGQDRCRGDRPGGHRGGRADHRRGQHQRRRRTRQR